MTPSYIHLHLHSEFSLVDGLIRMKPLIKHCVETQVPAVAVTDHCNLFAAVKFYKQAHQAGIKPIIGAELLIQDPTIPKQFYPGIFLCQNQQGYRNLTKLVSKAYVQGQATGQPIVNKAWIAELSTGIIMLSGGRQGDIGMALLNENIPLAKTYLEDWQRLFGDRFYLELQRTGRPQEETYLQGVLALAEKSGVGVVATNDVRFLKVDDFEAHEARVCIHGSYVLDDPSRPRHYSEQQYFRSQEEMQTLFTDIPSALANTVEIAKRCNVELNLGSVYFPAFPTPDGSSIDDYFKTISKAGLEERLEKSFDISAEDFPTHRKDYFHRLEMELDVIIRMGFQGYFLIVADFIRWAKENGIPVGPGRGSGAGSLVAYVLKITDLDPIKYDLLFERFLNPERVSLPDFDIDFCMDGRDRVIDYVAHRYGRNCVSQIITFGTMAAKAVIRDVGRVLSYPYGFVDKIAKLIPFEVGMTLEKAFADEEELRQRYNQEEDVRNIFDLAKKLEGMARNAGKHAGGVVISPSDLTDFSPLYCEPGSASIVTQFDKDDVEAVGLVKFDFLGLRTLTIIDWALKIIKERHHEKIDISQINKDDSETFKLLKACKTTSVFQLESRGMKDLIKRLQPDCLEDIIALVALFRPGPLQSGMVDDFINRKHGRAVITYPHPNLEPILRPTYGVILYQEQVMQIAQVLAGYTLGGADMLRRAMGKKKPEEMAKQRAIFLAGALKNDISADTANSIFDLMEKFAGYGFNKSHSAAYAEISYQTAWLKSHYPAAFMCAVLTAEMDKTDKIVTFIDECYSLKLKIVAPNINQCDYPFTVSDQDPLNQTIIYGLGAIKGAGESAIELILANRKEAGPFKSLFDLATRVDIRKVNRRVFEALIYAGALDCFNQSRSTLLATLNDALKFAEQNSKNKASGQNDLFGSLTAPIESDSCQYTVMPEWSDEQRLQFEKESLGHYFSGHPLDRYQQELKKITTATLGNLYLQNSTTVTLAGLVSAVRTMFTKRGDRMAFISLSDRSGRVELAIFSDVYEEKRELIKKDEILVIEADVNYDETNATYKLSGKQIYTMEQARVSFSKFIQLSITPQQMHQDFISHLQQILQADCPGNCPVTIEYQGVEAKAQMTLDKQWWVNPSDKLISALRREFGFEQVKIYY